jgi:hypothetical protein
LEEESEESEERETERREEERETVCTSPPLARSLQHPLAVYERGSRSCSTQ